jgi:hypothetical protein
MTVDITDPIFNDEEAAERNLKNYVGRMARFVHIAAAWIARPNCKAGVRAPVSINAASARSRSRKRSARFMSAHIYRCLNGCWQLTCFAPAKKEYLRTSSGAR